MKFTISGRLDGLNEYTKANRTSKYLGNDIKKSNQFIVRLGINQAHLKPISKYPIALKIKWYEPNHMRDIDNITFATKFIQDELVESGIIKDDSQRYINRVEHEVLIDKLNPRIVVQIEGGEYE